MKIIKSFADRVMAFLGIIFLSPLILLFAIITLFKLKEFPFFIQERGLTLDKGRLKIIKIKTIASATVHKPLSIDNPLYKRTCEGEITAFSMWLRNKGLDEMPQLWNILLGKMSFVGPRPLMLSDLQSMKNNYPALYDIRDTINMKPGLTGLWQLYGDKTSGLPNLLFFDVFYCQHFSVFLDLKIMLGTFIMRIAGLEEHYKKVQLSRANKKIEKMAEEFEYISKTKDMYSGIIPETNTEAAYSSDIETEKLFWHNNFWNIYNNALKKAVKKTG